MRILVVSHAYVEPDNRQKLELLASQKNLEVGVVCPKKWRTWHGEIKDQKSKIEYQSLYKEFALDTFFSGDAGRYFYNPIQLIISVIKFGPELIYLEEEPFTPVAFQIGLVCLMLRIKLVFFSWENIDNLRLGWMRSLFEKLIFNLAVSAVAGTQGSFQRIFQRGFKKEIAIVPQFGVDITMFRRSLLVKETPSATPASGNLMLTIGFVGRPTPDKGIDILIKAVSKLVFDCRLLIVTSSKEIPIEILSLTKSLGIESKVTFETSIPHAELPSYFNKMDIFVLPSRTTSTWKEQFGRTLIEAMACGLPVVGSSSGAIPEVVGDSGLVFKENDVDDLADKLMGLIDENSRLSFSRSSQERVKSLYTDEIISQKLHIFLAKFSPTQNK